MTFCVAALSAAGAPTTNSPAPLSRIGRVNQDEGRAALAALRRLGIVGNYYLEFQLRVMPRRGDERLIPGHLWGGKNEIGPVSRVSLDATGPDSSTPARRLLIQNGPRSAAWRWIGDGPVELLGVASLFEPLVPGTDMTAFDLMMPFIYWTDFSYEGLTRFRGRPAHVILLRPPADFALRHPELKGVRVQLDAQFNALVQSELLGENDSTLKTLSLVDLKKVDDQWIPRTFDLRDERTRNKTRFDVTAVALGLDFAPGLFAPAQLADAIAAPGGGVVRKLTP